MRRKASDQKAHQPESVNERGLRVSETESSTIRMLENGGLHDHGLDAQAVAAGWKRAESSGQRATKGSD